jgi:hypothetical protein
MAGKAVLEIRAHGEVVVRGDAGEVLGEKNIAFDDGQGQFRLPCPHLA